MKTILVVNQKGGVGKTTISNEIAFTLERRGLSVCLINLDPQGSSIYPLTIPDGTQDYRVIDTPPQLHKDFQEWCRSADVILMPTKPSKVELAPFLRCHSLAIESNTKASIGTVINCYNKRLRVDRGYLKGLQNSGIEIWGTIPTTTVITQAQSEDHSVYSENKNHAARWAFEDLCDVIIKEANNAK